MESRNVQFLEQVPWVDKSLVRWGKVNSPSFSVSTALYPKVPRSHCLEWGFVGPPVVRELYACIYSLSHHGFSCEQLICPSLDVGSQRSRVTIFPRSTVPACRRPSHGAWWQLPSLEKERWSGLVDLVWEAAASSQPLVCNSTLVTYGLGVSEDAPVARLEKVNWGLHWCGYGKTTTKAGGRLSTLV